MKRKRNMKKLLTILLISAVLSGCFRIEKTALEIGDNTPVKVLYRRMWSYGADYECEDSDLIRALMSALKDAEIGQEVSYCVIDYSDIIVLYYADGSRDFYELEENNIVIDDRRYVLEGIGQIRYILSLIAADEW